MFYNVDGKTDKPRWFKMPVDIFYDSYGDMKNTDDVQEIIDIYQEDGQDFFHEIGLLLVNSILYHSDRDNETYFKMHKTESLLFRQIKSSGIDSAYQSWETKKNNLLNKKN